MHSGWQSSNGSELLRGLYRLGQGRATGVLTVREAGRESALVLRRGAVIVPASDVTGRAAQLLLARWIALPALSWSFDGGVQAYPPGPARQMALTAWVRAQLENQLDAARADALVQAWAGVRLSLRPARAPDASELDETDRRIIAALESPRRLDQIWSLARTPRFRLLTFLHFLRNLEALEESGIAAAPLRAAPVPDRHAEARRLLGLAPTSSPDDIKRAYRRVARALHPDLHGDLEPQARRELESKLAAVTAAYQALSA